MTHVKDVDDLYEKYPIPRTWRVAQWTLTVGLIGVALIMAWALEPWWFALIPFVLANPLVTIRLVSWVALALFGKPASWPDSGPSQ